jgi:hypothetical protein
VSDPPDEVATLNALIRELLAERPTRYGWKRSAVPQELYDWILGREAIHRAIREVQAIRWQDICDDKQRGEQLRENVLHSLACIARAMGEREKDLL